MFIPVVRLCPADTWGIVRQGEDGERPGDVGKYTCVYIFRNNYLDTELSCTNECPKCYNGGVCSEYTGECICAPGNLQQNEICIQNLFSSLFDKHLVVSVNRLQRSAM